MREGRIRFRRAGGSRDEAAQGATLLAGGDGWSRAVVIVPRDQEQIRILRAVLGAVLRGSRPAPQSAWLDVVRALDRRENREAHAALLALFGALAEAVPYAAPEAAADAHPLLVGEQNTTAAVNTVWAAAELFGPKCVPELGRILARALSEPWTVESGRIRDACIAALAGIGTEQALEALLEASRRAPAKPQREQILLVLERTGRGGRMPPSRQAELHVADHGLDGRGHREITVHRHVFELILAPDGRVLVVDRDEAATPDAAAERVVAAEARSLRAAYGRELRRIEALLATGRTWTYEEWRTVYLDNPITRAVAARLVWRMEYPDGRAVDVLPSDDGGISASRPATPVEDAVPGADGRGPGKRPADPRREGLPETVRLWHPRDAEPGQLAAWRTIRDDLRLVQPFEQIDRDFTRVDPDPDGAELNQYTAALLRAQDFDAALGRLGWHSRASKAGAAADAVRLVYRDFPDDGLTVTVSCRESTGAGGDEIALGAGWFHRSEDRARTPLPLGYVPPRMHSEALRDIAVLARAAHDTDDGGITDDLEP